MAAPPMLLNIGGSDDEGDGLPQLQPSASDRSLQESFMLSQSGTFKTEDFKLNKTGLVMQDISAEGGGSPDRGAGSGGSPSGANGLEVKDISELETLGELGRGASGVVYKARHTPSGTIVAVKQVPILEKPKRDQIVSELRIMRQHQCPWLVPLFNAFYDDAKVYTVLELMDGGSVEDLVAKHAPDGGLKDERELGKLALQMLNGLNYLHRNCHQIHRDLKVRQLLGCSKSPLCLCLPCLPRSSSISCALLWSRRRRGNSRMPVHAPPKCLSLRM